VELPVEPEGAEFAHPSEEVVGSPPLPEVEGDPDGRVLVDEDGLIDVETLSIPTVARPGKSVRIHLAFEPDRGRDAHWNNEAGPSSCGSTRLPDGESAPGTRCLSLGSVK